MYFKHFSVKIQRTNLILVSVLSSARQHSIRERPPFGYSLGPSLVTFIGMFPFSQNFGHYYCSFLPKPLPDLR